MGPKIGMFDSGVGGLTVARAVQKRMPQSSLIYYGDTARAPYGCRSKEELRRFGQEIIGFLLSHRVDVVVVACNTSSAQVLDELRNLCPVPVIGMVDAAIAMAGRYVPGKKIGLLATESTVASGAFERAAAQWNTDRPETEQLLWVVSQACPRFVPLVEAGLADSEEALAAARSYGQKILRAGAEAVILGCTHYPYLRGPLQEYLGPGMVLLDPADEVAEQVAAVVAGIKESDVGKKETVVGKKESVVTGGPPVVETWAEGLGKGLFYVSGNGDLFWQAGRMFMGEGFSREAVKGPC